MKLLLPIALIVMVVLGCSAPPSTNKSTAAKTPSAPASHEFTDAEIIDDVKAHIKDLKSGDSGTGYAIYTQLKKISESSPQYPQAKQLFAQLKPQLTSAVREMCRDDYESSLQDIFSHMNGIKVKTVRSGNGFALMGYHSYFTSQTFDLGEQAREVQKWVVDNNEDLEYSGVVRVGVASTQGLGSQWYYVK
jgi:hypothetical protein